MLATNTYLCPLLHGVVLGKQRDAHLIFNPSTEFFVHGVLLISFMNHSLPWRLIIYLFDF